MNEPWPDMPNVHIGKRIAYARMRGHLSQHALAERLGLSRVSVTNWESGEHAMQREREPAIAEALSCPPGWLHLGVDLQQRNAEIIGEDTGDHPHLPLISSVPAGAAEDATDPYAPGVAEDWLRPSRKMSGRSFIVRVHGDSMEPGLSEGMVVFVDPGLAARSGDLVVVRFDESNTVTLKELVIDGDRKYLKPHNPRYPIREIESEATICGVVREHRKIYR